MHCYIFQCLYIFSQASSAVVRPVCLFVLLEPFSWEDYLRETSSIAASPSCFKQVDNHQGPCLKSCFIHVPDTVFCWISFVNIKIQSTIADGTNAPLSPVSLYRPESPRPMTLKQAWSLRPGTLATPTLCASPRWWVWWALAYGCAWTAATTPMTSGGWWTR